MITLTSALDVTMEKSKLAILILSLVCWSIGNAQSATKVGTYDFPAPGLGNITVTIIDAQEPVVEPFRMTITATCANKPGGKPANRQIYPTTGKIPPGSRGFGRRALEIIFAPSRAVTASSNI